MGDYFEIMIARRWGVRERLFSLFLVGCQKSAPSPFPFLDGPLDEVLSRPRENFQTKTV